MTEAACTYSMFEHRYYGSKTNTMTWLIVICILCGAICIHILRIRVPAGITEPLKYRLLLASLIFPNILEAIYVLLHPKEKFARIQANRYIIEYLEPTPPSVVEGSNIRSRVTTFDGVKVRIYEPIVKKAGLLPGIIFMHGGGMATGSIDSYDGLTRTISERLDMFLVSLDYRLSPEHPFPAGYNDNVKASKWFLRNAEEFGVDASRVTVAGDSAGACFAAAVSHAVHDDDSLPNLKLQVLVYPALHQLDFHTPSYQKYDADFGEGGVLSRKRIANFITMYLHGEIDPDFVHRTVADNAHITPQFRNSSPTMQYVHHEVIPPKLRCPTYYTPFEEWQHKHSGDEILWNEMKRFCLDPRFAPLVREKMDGLPKAMITTCGFDILRDDGIFYARRLGDAGVDVEWKHYESAFHGVMWASSRVQFEVGHRMLDDVLEFIQTNL